MTVALARDDDRIPHGGAAIAAVLASLGEHRAEFVGFARRRVPSDADAEDLVQQAFARAAEKVGELRDPDAAVAWFYRVLRRLIADHAARRALGARKLGEIAATLDESTPEEAASCACALGLLGRLRPEYGEVVRRVDLEDEPIEAVAASLGITPNNAYVRLHRARHKLRAEVEALCGPGLAAARRACADCDCPPGEVANLAGTPGTP